MISAFVFGMTVAFAAGLAGEFSWRRLPTALSALAVALGGAAAVSVISLAAHLHLHLRWDGAAVPALVVGLLVGGQFAHNLAERHTTRTR